VQLCGYVTGGDGRQREQQQGGSQQAAARGGLDQAEKGEEQRCGGSTCQLCNEP